VVRTGPHILQGIEIYKGKPIFYSTSSLFFTLGTNWPEDWYETFIASVEYRGGKASVIRLHPVSLGKPSDRRPSERQGVPELVVGAEAQRILRYVQRRSARFGTTITIENDVGMIRLP
jgi:poly-gamma-glutamate synthesis protein (capsule biosynthesis protein)